MQNCKRKCNNENRKAYYEVDNGRDDYKFHMKYF